MAKIFDAYTIKGSVVMENIAGIESMANKTSDPSIRTRIANRGVA